MDRKYSPLDTDPQGPGWSRNALLGTALAAAHCGLVFWLTFVVPHFYHCDLEGWLWEPVAVAGYFVFMGWRDVRTDHRQGGPVVGLGALLMVAAVVMATSQYV